MCKETARIWVKVKDSSHPPPQKKKNCQLSVSWQRADRGPAVSRLDQQLTNIWPSVCRLLADRRPTSLPTNVGRQVAVLHNYQNLSADKEQGKWLLQLCYSQARPQMWACSQAKMPLYLSTFNLQFVFSYPGHRSVSSFSIDNWILPTASTTDQWGEFLCWPTISWNCKQFLFLQILECMYSMASQGTCKLCSWTVWCCMPPHQCTCYKLSKKGEPD